MSQKFEETNFDPILVHISGKVAACIFPLIVLKVKHMGAIG